MFYVSLENLMVYFTIYMDEGVRRMESWDMKQRMSYLLFSPPTSLITVSNMAGSGHSAQVPGGTAEQRRLYSQVTLQSSSCWSTENVDLLIFSSLIPQGCTGRIPGAAVDWEHHFSPQNPVLTCAHEGSLGTVWIYALILLLQG